MITNLQMVSIYVNDLERAVAFYTEKLGFVETARFDDGAGTQLVWVIPVPARDDERPTEIALCAAPADDPRVGVISGMVFTSPDIEATYRELKARGVTFSLDLVRHDYGSPPGDQEARFVDPDGNEFSLHT